MRAWNQTPSAIRPTSGPAIPIIPKLVMGDRLDAILAAGQRNSEEGRLVSMDGLFDRA
jgi:hypothetical protein